MSKTSEFLKSLSDQEFVYFLKYKSDKYFGKSIEYIQEEAKFRNLSDEFIINCLKRPIKSKTQTELQCPRCNSLKIIAESKQLMNTSKIQAIDGIINGTEIKYDKLTCLVCDYIISDLNS